MDVRDRRDLVRMDHLEEVDDDLVVRVLQRRRALHLDLDFERREEGDARGDAEAARRQFFVREHADDVLIAARVVVRLIDLVSRDVLAAVVVQRIGADERRVERVDHALRTVQDDRRRVVAGEHQVRVLDEVLGQRDVPVVEVLAGEVQTVGFVGHVDRVGDDALAHARLRADRFEQSVRDVARPLRFVVRLETVGLRADDEAAAALRIAFDRRDLVRGVERIAHRDARALERDGQNEQIAVLKHRIGDRLGDVLRLDAVLRRKLDERRVAVRIVAGDVEVAVVCVDQHQRHILTVADREAELAVEHVFRAAERAGDLRLHRISAGFGRRVGPGQLVVLLAGLQHVGAVGKLRRVVGIHELVVDHVFRLGDLEFDRGGILADRRFFVVVERDAERDRLALELDRGVLLDRRHADLDGFARPDGRGHRDIGVDLVHADVVVGVVVVEFDLPGAGLCVEGLARHGHVAVRDDGYLLHLVGRILEVHTDRELFALFEVQNRTHDIVVQGVVDLQIVVLGGVHRHGAHGVVDALLGEVVGIDDVTAGVAVAPAALVVVLVVRRRKVPALVQRHRVVLV